MERLTKACGIGPDGEPWIELAKRDGRLFSENLQEALRKLARYEDREEREQSARKDDHFGRK